MNSKPGYRKSVLYNFLCYTLIFGFLYYWVFTISLVFFNKKTRTVFPKQVSLYSSFFKQNWTLFAKPKPYNKEINFIIRPISNPIQADTLHLEKYWMQQKRKHAPFNSYEDALERVLNSTLIDIDRTFDLKRASFKKQFPEKQDSIFMQQLLQFLQTDHHQKENIEYLERYGRSVLAHKNINTINKEFQITFVRNYILPSTAPMYKPGKTNTEIIFTTAYKPF